ncbi:MAG TPA: hypothetical protein VNI52_14305 [Sphingobacteriaceae bacterium]|nr:hypothetical protein [Sphingobacteriaceae bacterium]
MNYKKSQPKITYSDFSDLGMPLKTFKSLRGKQYEVISIIGSSMNFIRKSSGKNWKMDLKGVLMAYKELNDFKTANFKPYVPRTHSPALGLLLHVGLLK